LLMRKDIPTPKLEYEGGKKKTCTIMFGGEDYLSLTGVGKTRRDRQIEEKERFLQSGDKRKRKTRKEQEGRNITGRDISQTEPASESEGKKPMRGGRKKGKNAYGLSPSFNTNRV